MKYILSLLALGLLVAGPALAGGNELAYKRVIELETLSAGSIASGDFGVVYDTSTGKTKKYDITGQVAAQNPGVDFFNICGEATTINNNTIYYGPGTTLTANSANGQDCDINAVGNATEATADAPIYTNKAVQVVGMTCRNEGDQDAAISYTLRTAAGATVPSVTCTIADGERDCVADVQTTTAIAAGATVAIAAASAGNIADNKGFNCKVSVVY